MCLLAQTVHGALLQASARPNPGGTGAQDVTAVPVALREAAFLESADCYTAMIASTEVHLPACAAPSYVCWAGVLISRSLNRCLMGLLAQQHACVSPLAARHVFTS